MPQLISCDEAGFTGNAMLDADQPYFAYASHDLSEEEANDLVARLRKDHGLQMPELKSSKLLRRPRGQAALADALRSMDGRFLTSLADKKFSLAGKFFEYIYEPVLQENNALFYQNNLHRFVANFLYMMMVASGRGADALAAEFEAFMRTLDPAEAPSLFGGELPTADITLGPILRFAQGYNLRIAEETRDLKFTGDGGKWILDLTLTSVFSHLRYWADRHDVLDVVCDDSKPLRALADVLNVMIGRTDTPYMVIGDRKTRLTWNMAGPIAFASSATHAGIQLADIVAGATVAVAQAKESEHQAAREILLRHMSEDCLLPDMDHINLDLDEPTVNAVVLEELADRADNGLDPLFGMPEYYGIVKSELPRFRRGEFRHAVE